MKTRLFLRIASILTLLYCAGHSSGYPWTPATGDQASAIVGSMKSQQFDVAGSMRSYWDFYVGFGLAISGFMLVIAILFWQLATLAKEKPGIVRPIVLVSLVGFVFNTIIDIQYFFVIPLVFAIAISLCLLLAFIFAGSEQQASKN